MHQKGDDVVHRCDVGSLNTPRLSTSFQGKYAEAEPLYRRALNIIEKALDPRHIDAVLALITLADTLGAQVRVKTFVEFSCRSIQFLLITNQYLVGICWSRMPL